MPSKNTFTEIVNRVNLMTHRPTSADPNDLSWVELTRREHELYRGAVLKLIEERSDVLCLLNATDDDMIAWRMDGGE